MPLEQLQRESRLVPKPIAASPVLAVQIVVGERVAEIPLATRPAGHQVSPEMTFADLVVVWIVGVRFDTRIGGAYLVETNDPGMIRLGRMSRNVLVDIYKKGRR